MENRNGFHFCYCPSALCSTNGVGRWSRSKCNHAGGLRSVLPMWVVISSILGRQPRKPWNSPEGTVARRGSPEIQGWANASELAAWLELEALVSGEFKFLSQTGELSAESGSHRPGSSQRFTKSKPKKYFLHLLSFFSASF